MERLLCIILNNDGWFHEFSHSVIDFEKAMFAHSQHMLITINQRTEKVSAARMLDIRKLELEIHSQSARRKETAR